MQGSVNSLREISTIKAIFLALVFFGTISLLVLLLCPAAAEASITVSGTLYSDEGITPITTGPTIKMAVATSSTSVHTATADGSGVFTFSLATTSLTATTSFVVWVDGDAGNKATLVSRFVSTSTNLTGQSLFKDHVIIRQQATSSIYGISVYDLAFYDFDDDSDIGYIASSTASTSVSVNAGNELYLWQDTHFSSRNGVTIHANAGSGTDGSLELAGGAWYYGGNEQLSVAGNFVMTASSTFVSHASGTVFTATSTGKTILATMSASTSYQSLGKLTFRGSGGGWTFSSHATGSDILINAGTVNIASGISLTVRGNFTHSQSGDFSNAGTLIMGPAKGDKFSTATSTSITTNTGTAGNNSLDFKPDGTRMYVSTTGNTSMTEYTLSTPWDVSSKSVRDTLTVSTGNELIITPDGTTIYTVNGNKSVEMFRLSSPWDLTTASASSTVYTLTEPATIEGMEFNNDGTRLYVAQRGNAGTSTVYTYALTQPWEIASSSLSFLYSYGTVIDSIEGDLEGISFSRDGTLLYVMGRASDEINTLQLSTPWEVSTSTVTASNHVLDYAAITGNVTVRDLYVSPDGRRIYIYENDADIHTFAAPENRQSIVGTSSSARALGTVIANSGSLLTFSAGAASTSDLTIASGTTTLANPLTVSGNFANNGSLLQKGRTYFSGSGKTISGTLTGNSGFNDVSVSGSYTLSNNASATDLTIASGGAFTATSGVTTLAGDYTNNGTFTHNSGTVAVGRGMGDLISTSTVVSVDAYDLSGDGDGFRGLYFSPDGRRMYIVRNGGTGTTGVVTEYTLTTPWDVTTRSVSDTFTSGTSANWNIIATPDGRRFYLSAAGDGSMRPYDVSTPWDLRTIIYVGAKYTLAHPSNVSFEFSKDGSQLYVVGVPNIYTYQLSIPWEISSSSATYHGQYTVSAQVGDPQGIAFNHDGTVMYLADRSGDDITAYALATPWDVSTSSVSLIGTQYNFAAYETDVRDSFLGNNGRTFYTIGNSNELNVFNLRESSQTLSGTMTGSSAFNHLTLNNSTATTTLAATASTTNLTINASSTLNASGTTVSVAGNYQNSGTLSASTSTFVFNGTSAQVATGTMSSSSKFYNLSITNTSQNGTTSRSVTFGAPLTASGTMTMIASTSAGFLANATTTLQNVSWQGSATAPVWLRSTATGTQWYLDIPGSQLSVEHVDVKDSRASSTVVALNSVDSENNVNWNFINSGTLTFATPEEGQIENTFTFQNKNDEPLYAFTLAPVGENATITTFVLSASDVSGIIAPNLTDWRLYRDFDADQIVDGTDEQIGGGGVFAITETNASTTFSTSFVATTTQHFLVTADIYDLDRRDQLSFSINPVLTTATGQTYNVSIVPTGSVASVRHIRAVGGAGNDNGGITNTGAIGNGIVSGGETGVGEELGGLPNFNPPSSNGSPHSEWANGSNGYTSDGSYTSETTAAERQAYGTFGFNIPSSNSITGIEVKLEASASTNAGTIEVALSWDGGTLITTPISTATLSTNDTIYTLGGSSNLWGRAWSTSEFQNGNFVVRLIGQPSGGNTVQVDAIQVRVYHATTGGGNGGGSGEI